MKRILAILFLCSVSIAATVRFAWDSHQEQSQLSMFRFYEFTETSTNLLGSVTPETYTFKHNFQRGAHSVFVTAVSLDGVESEPSNVVTFLVPRAPQNVAILVNP